jgi:hypothetical protein
MTMPTTMPTSPAIIPTTVPDLSHLDGTHDLFAHYVLSRPGDVTAAYVFGTTLTALCGKVWIPSRDPAPLPVCPTCKETKGNLT